MTLGGVYIQSNPSIHESNGKPLYKVGITGRTVEKRRKELSSATGVPTEFKIEYEIEVANYKEVEKIIHNRLAKDRVNPKREFFRGSLEDIKKTIDRAVSESMSILSSVRPEWNGGDDWEVRDNFYCTAAGETPKEIAHKFNVCVKLLIHANTISGPTGGGIPGLKPTSKMLKNTEMVIPIYQILRRSLRRSSRL